MDEIAKVIMQVYEERMDDTSYIQEKREQLEKATRLEAWHSSNILDADSKKRFSELLANRIQIDGGAEAIRDAIQIWRKLDFEIDITSRPYTRPKIV